MKPKTQNKLNERNVVDIVQKLIAHKRVQLIYTQDGKDYLTPDQLENEIKELVQTNSGRMSLSEISAHLGVGVEVVEPKVIEICGMGHGKIVNGSLIT